ncbi:MAG: aminotransferase class I/II-fold pyridoxal phosphate-dependent enzyme, partial [Mesorhizobium sp.]
VAAAHALNGDGADIAEVRDIYHKRRDVMVDAFSRAGWVVPAPAASMFAWAPIPEPFKHLGSLEFSKLLIEHADVAVAHALNGDGADIAEVR